MGGQVRQHDADGEQPQRKPDEGQSKNKNCMKD